MTVNRDLRFLGRCGEDYCDEYFLVADKRLSEESVKTMIAHRNFLGAEELDPSTVDDLVTYNDIEFILSERWTIVRLLTYG